MAKAKCKYTNIGGQALIEGIMMRGPKKTSMAVRNRSGDILIETSNTPANNRPKVLKLPFVRGIFGLIDSLKVGYRCLNRSAELSGIAEEDEAAKKDKKPPSAFRKRAEALFEKLMMPIAMVLAMVLAVALFMFLPTLLYTWLSLAVPSIAGNYFLRSLFEGIVRLVIFVGYVAATALMKDIYRTYQYHGAEHKTIFCYEKGLPLTVENVRAQSRFHPRCGTSFLVLMLIVGIVVSFFIRTTNPVLRTLLKLVTVPVLVGIGYELIQFAGRHDNWLTRAISAPGVVIQHITTKEPGDEMIECAIAAMERVVPDAPERPDRETLSRAAQQPAAAAE